MGHDDASILVPTTDVPLDRDRVWCASLDLAWKELCALAGGPIELRDAPEGATRLSTALNASTLQPEEIDPEACIAVAGIDGIDWSRKAVDALMVKFGAMLDMTMFFADRPRPDMLVACSFLAKHPEFGAILGRVTGSMRFGETVVDSVRLRPDAFDAQSKLVHVHHHAAAEGETKEEFVVELLTQDSGDQLVIARGPKQPTLAAMIEWATSQLKANVTADPKARLTPDDRFTFPCISFDFTRSYEEIENRPFIDPASEQTIGLLHERVRFRLHEGGATSVSEPDVRKASPTSRSLVFDGPFFLMMRRRGATRPFLAAWVATPELLVKSP